MKITDICKVVERIETKTDYWFVRTNNGALFEDFLKGEYVAIEWDYVTLNMLKNGEVDKIRSLISKHENIDIEDPAGKGKITTIYNKINNFLTFQKNDVVIMPSRNSDRLAFGRIDDNKAYEAGHAKDFLKRRKVHWQEVKQIDDLNSIFYQVKSNQHAISNIKKFAPHIDRVIGNLFLKEERTHYVLNIEKTEDVDFDELSTLMENIKTLVHNINETFNLGEQNENVFIKINLQSRGTFELIRKGKSLAVLAYLIYLSSCNPDMSQQDQQITDFVSQNREVLESTTRVIDSLKINTDELIRPFEDYGN